MAQVAEQGRIASHTTEVELKRGAAQRTQREAERNWHTWTHPAWLTDQFYAERIRPRLDGLEIKALAASLGVSIPYASSIRAGRRKRHPRHWETLAKPVGN
jgi:hypothetical protein